MKGRILSRCLNIIKFRFEPLQILIDLLSGDIVRSKLREDVLIVLSNLHKPRLNGGITFVFFGIYLSLIILRCILFSLCLFLHQILYVSNEVTRILTGLKAQFLVERYRILAYPRNVLAQPRIKMIFNGVVGAARDHFGDFGPAIPKLSMGLNKLIFLLLAPLSLAN